MRAVNWHWNTSVQPGESSETNGRSYRDVQIALGKNLRAALAAYSISLTGKTTLSIVASRLHFHRRKKQTDGKIVNDKGFSVLSFCSCIKQYRLAN